MSAPDEPTPPIVPPPPPPPPPARAVTGPDAAAWAGPAARAVTGRDADAVPELDDRDRPLDRRVVNVWRVSTALGLVLPLVPVTVVAYLWLGGRGLAIGAVLLALATAFVAWYPKARYDRWRWRLTDLAVELDHGVVVRQAEALPYFRIQQIDVTRGPVDRLLGLASLQVTSASASGSVTLPGIAADQAPGVRRALLARASAAVEAHDTGVSDAV